MKLTARMDKLQQASQDRDHEMDEALRVMTEAVLKRITPEEYDLVRQVEDYAKQGYRGTHPLTEAEAMAVITWQLTAMAHWRGYVRAAEPGVCLFALEQPGPDGLLRPPLRYAGIRLNSVALPEDEEQEEEMEAMP